MTLKKYNIIQTSEGIMNGYYIGCIWATDYHHIGNSVVFMNGTECLAVMNFVRVEEGEENET